MQLAIVGLLPWQQFDFDVQYRPGKANIDADLLFRNMADLEDDGEWVNVSPTAVKSICQHVQIKESSEESPRYVEQLGASPACVPDAYAFPSQLHQSSLEQFSKTDLIKAQKNDDVLEQVIRAVTHGDRPSRKDPVVMLFKREASKLKMRDGLLYCVGKKCDVETLQLVLPSELGFTVLHAMHDVMGLLGVERVTDLLRARFYWPKMATDVEDYLQNCGQCVTRKTPSKKMASLHHIVSSAPMDLVCIDFLSMEPNSRGIGNVLIVTDHFNRYAQAFPNQKALKVAKILVEKSN